MNIIDRIGNKQIENVLGQRKLPQFAPGDTLRVDVKVIEGARERIQVWGPSVLLWGLGLHGMFGFGMFLTSPGVCMGEFWHSRLKLQASSGCIHVGRASARCSQHPMLTKGCYLTLNPFPNVSE